MGWRKWNRRAMIVSVAFGVLMSVFLAALGSKEGFADNIRYWCIHKGVYPDPATIRYWHSEGTRRLGDDEDGIWWNDTCVNLTVVMWPKFYMDWEYGYGWDGAFVTDPVQLNVLFCILRYDQQLHNWNSALVLSIEINGKSFSGYADSLPSGCIAMKSSPLDGPGTLVHEIGHKTLPDLYGVERNFMTVDIPSKTRARRDQKDDFEALN